MVEVITAILSSLKVSEYYKEIPQPHTADQPTVPCGRATKHLQ